MEEEAHFCTKCGKNLEPGMQFCPQCGSVVSGSEAESEMKENLAEAAIAAGEMRRTWLTFLLFIYAIPVTIAGIMALADASALADAIWESGEFQSWLGSHDLSYTHDDIESYITYVAAMILASGICAIGCGALVYKKRKWIFAVILCAIASMLCFWSIFGMIIGFLVCWLIIDSKTLFED